MKIYPSYVNFDGADLREKSLHHLDISNLLDTTKEITLNGTYSVGSSYYKSKQNPRKFALNGWFWDIDSLNELRSKINSLGLKKLIVTYPGIQTFYVNCEAENMAVDMAGQKVSIALTAPDPRMFANDAVEISLGGTYNNGLSFPMTFPIVFGSATGATGIITNDGNETGYPVFTIIGECSNITISNVTTGESMDLNVALSTGDTLIVDCENYEITLNGVKNMGLKSGDWISCQPGANEISFARTSLEEIEHCTVSFRSVWI